MSISGAPAPVDIGTQMFAQGTMTKMIAQYTQQGKSADQAMDWAASETRRLHADVARVADSPPHAGEALEIRRDFLDRDRDAVAVAMLALLRVAPLLPSPTLRAAAAQCQVGTGKQALRSNRKAAFR